VVVDVTLGDQLSVLRTNWGTWTVNLQFLGWYHQTRGMNDRRMIGET